MEIKTKFNVGDIAWVECADDKARKIIVKEIKILSERGVGIAIPEEDDFTIIYYKNEGLTDQDEDWFDEDSLYIDKLDCDNAILERQAGINERENYESEH